MSGQQGQHQLGWLGYEQRAGIAARPLSIGAALWRLDQDTQIEFFSPEMPDTYLVCAHLEGAIDWDCRMPTRRYHRPGVAQTFCMGFPGEQGDVILKDAHSSFVHFYIPKELMQVQLADLAPATNAAGVEFIDPMNGTDPVVDSFARHAAHLMVQHVPTSRLLVEATGLQLAAHLISRHSNMGAKTAHRKSGGLAPWQIRRVCDYMEDHLEKDISLSELGEITDLSPNHFCSAFRVSLGMPPHAWLLQTRMKRAKTMLANPRFSLTEIALAVGYTDQSAFGAAFRRVNAFTPTQWRKNLAV